TNQQSIRTADERGIRDIFHIRAAAYLLLLLGLRIGRLHCSNHCLTVVGPLPWRLASRIACIKSGAAADTTIEQRWPTWFLALPQARSVGVLQTDHRNIRLRRRRQHRNRI